MKDILILGISCYYHDAAACIVKNGEIIAASSEERFTRIKGDSSFPHNAINFCLNEVGKSIKEVDYIVYYEDNIQKFSRIVMEAHMNVPKGILSYIYGMPKWINEKIWIESKIKEELGIKQKKQIEIIEHHMSHASSAFYPSPFEKAAILTIDGVGEWTTTSYGVGDGNKIRIEKEIKYPDSIGLLYSAFTYYTGFKINSGEYKLMGLAPYGTPRYVDVIKEKLVKIYDDGSVKLNQEYFNYRKGLKMTNKKFNELFGGRERKAESKITQREMDIAASIQEVLNEIILKLANHVYEETGMTNLVMAGGVALNIASIGYIKRNSKFENIWVQPASSDAGGALGAALNIWYEKLGNNRIVDGKDKMRGAFLGIKIEEKDENIDKEIEKNGGIYHYLDENELIEKISSQIEKGRVIGIARGRAEFGPRALGNRSILADARDKEMQKRLNIKIKKRESFRPFAPMVLKEDAKKYFEIDEESPYMLSTYMVKEEIRKEHNKEKNGLELLNEKRSDIPAVTHIDYSARVQTIDKEKNEFIYKVINRFKDKTGCSVVINTSFNVRGEPIVNTEIEAYKCFMETEMDSVIIGNRYFEKEEQDIEKYKRNNKKRKKYTPD